MSEATTESRIIAAISEMNRTSGTDISLINLVDIVGEWYWEVAFEYDGEYFEECGFKPTMIEAAAEIFDIVHPDGREAVNQL